MPNAAIVVIYPEVLLKLITPVTLLKSMSPVALISVNAIPTPPADVKSGPGAHCKPSHFSTCPVVGVPE